MTQHAATETRIAIWTSPSGAITIELVALHTGIYQTREKANGGTDYECLPWATEAEARIWARGRAEAITLIESLEG